MSVAIAGTGGDLGLQITVKNVGEKPLLLPFGNLIGSEFYDFRFRVFVRAPDDIVDKPVIYTGGPGGVAGRLDPLVVPLVPNASYSVQIPLARFYVTGRSETLSTFILKRAQLWVEIDARKAVCPLYGPPNPNMIACWQSKVVSNTLRLPK